MTCNYCAINVLCVYLCVFSRPVYVNVSFSSLYIFFLLYILLLFIQSISYIFLLFYCPLLLQHEQSTPVEQIKALLSYHIPYLDHIKHTKLSSFVHVHIHLIQIGRKYFCQQVDIYNSGHSSDNFVKNPLRL